MAQLVSSCLVLATLHERLDDAGPTGLGTILEDSDLAEIPGQAFCSQTEATLPEHVTINVRAVSFIEKSDRDATCTSQGVAGTKKRDCWRSLASSRRT